MTFWDERVGIKKKYGNVGTEEKVGPIYKPDQSNFYRNLHDKSCNNNVSKGATIRNRYNQVPQLTQDTNGKVTN